MEGIHEFDDFYYKVSEIQFGAEENLQHVLEHVMVWGELWSSGIVFCILHELTPAVMDITDWLIAGGIIVVIYVITDQEPMDYVRQGSLRKRIVVIPVEAGLEGRL